jgi:hypothetical protein
MSLIACLSAMSISDIELKPLGSEAVRLPMIGSPATVLYHGVIYSGVLTRAFDARREGAGIAGYLITVAPSPGKSSKS